MSQLKGTFKRSKKVPLLEGLFLRRGAFVIKSNLIPDLQAPLGKPIHSAEGQRGGRKLKHRWV